MATHTSILAWRIPQTEEPGAAVAVKVLNWQLSVFNPPWDPFKMLSHSHGFRRACGTPSYFVFFDNGL